MFFFFSPSLLFPGTQRQLEVKVLDFCYSTDNSINKPHRLPPLLAAPTICTQINYNVQTKKKQTKTPKKTMLHCYIIITCSKRKWLVAVRTPHSTQFFRLVQRGCKTSWEVLFTKLCTVCLFHALDGGKFTQRRPSSN